MARILSILSLLSVAMAAPQGNNLRAAAQANDTLPSGPGLMASATFLGFDVMVSRSLLRPTTLVWSDKAYPLCVPSCQVPHGTVLKLSFVPTFGPSTIKVSTCCCWWWWCYCY